MYVETVRNCISRLTSSSDTGEISQVERELEALICSGDFAETLLDIVRENNILLSMRQLSGIVLKRYLQRYWNENFLDFFELEELQKKKETFKDNLLKYYLMETEENILNITISVIVEVAKIDSFPDKWTDLCNWLGKSLQNLTNNLTDVRKAFKLMNELFYHNVLTLKPTHLTFLIYLLPGILKVLKYLNSEFSIIKMATDTFTSIISLIHNRMALQSRCLEADVDLRGLSIFVAEFLTVIISSLKVCDSYGVAVEAQLQLVKSIRLLVDDYGEELAEPLEEIFKLIWIRLVHASENFRYKVICDNSNNVINNTIESETTKELLIQSILFIRDIIYKDRNRITWATVSKDQMVTTLLTFLYLTAFDCEHCLDLELCDWKDSLRGASLHLIASIINFYGEEALDTLGKALTSAIVNDFSNNNFINRWKVLEGCLFLLENLTQPVATMILIHGNRSQLEFFLHDVFITSLNENVHPILIGRSLVFVALYSSFISSQNVIESLDKAILTALLHESKPIISSYFALKALLTYCKNSKHQEDFVKVFDSCIPKLLEFLPINFKTSQPEINKLYFETLLAMSEVRMEVIASLQFTLVPFVISAIVKHSCHSSTSNLLILFGRNVWKSVPDKAMYLQKLLELFRSALNGVMDANCDDVLLGLSLEMLNVALFENAIDGRTAAQFINSEFISLILNCSSSTSAVVVEQGYECLRALISNYMDEVSKHVNFSGTFIDEVLDYLLICLNPKSPPGCCNHIDHIVLVIITRLNLTFDISQGKLFRAVLSKVVSTECLQEKEALLTIFVICFLTDLKLTLEFLDSLPGPQSESALIYIIKELLCKCPYFETGHRIRASLFFIAELLKYCLSTKDVRLYNLTVLGDQVVLLDSTKNVNSNASELWTTIPIISKLFKLILLEIRSFLESDSQELMKLRKEEIYISSLTATDTFLDGVSAVTESGGEDKNHIIPTLYSAFKNYLKELDLMSYLVSVIKSLLYEVNYFDFKAHLNAQEIAALRTIGAISNAATLRC